MAIGTYTFEPHSWPPPESRQREDSYLFGFDEDNRPYIVKWEDDRRYRGWIATTLSVQKSGDGTAVPRHYLDDEVEKLIKHWADAPLLRQVTKEVREGTYGDRVIRYRDY